jgi:hypothetical protein
VHAVESSDSLRTKRGRSNKSKSKKNGSKIHHGLILSRDAFVEHMRALGSLPNQFVTIDFESFFDCEPSEVALSCVVLNPNNQHEVLATMHALIAPCFEGPLTTDQTKAATYVMRNIVCQKKCFCVLFYHFSTDWNSVCSSSCCSAH